MSKVAYDKQLTRWARMGYKKVLLWGSWHELRDTPGHAIHVVYNRRNPQASYLREVEL